LEKTILNYNLPVVAIMGSPNVGKSTLFNRLVGKRRAITDPTPGVTRDPISTVCVLNGSKVLLMDTGGYKDEELDFIDKIVSDKSLGIGEQAELILFLVDVKELTGNDKSLLEKIRPYQDKVVLVVTKVDNKGLEQQIWDMYRLGFKKVIGISAAHNRNIEELKDIIKDAVKSFKVNKSEIEEADVRLAILGKPNTGKSTLYNYLLGEEKSIVSDIPGTTRDVIEDRFTFKGVSFQVLDTAGIRKKKKVKNSVEYYSVNRAISSIKLSDVVFLLVDAQTGLTEQDKKIVALIEKGGKGIIIVLNKWDLIKEIPNQLAAMQDRISFLFPSMKIAPILPVSSISGAGVDKLLKTSVKIRKQLDVKLNTPKLNKALKQWVLDFPPSQKGRLVKFRYITQISSNPMYFVVFINNAKGLPKSYPNYIINSIRKDFKLDMVPIKLEFRENKPKK